MTSLELETRLDNLLATAQIETAAIDLYAPMAEREECLHSIHAVVNKYAMVVPTKILRQTKTKVYQWKSSSVPTVDG